MDELAQGGQTPIEETPTPIRPLHAKMKEMHPDREFSSDDDYESAAIESLEQALHLREKTLSANQKLVDIFDMHPEVLGFIQDIAKGASAKVALARNFDLANITPQSGDPDETEWGKALQEGQSKLENNRKMQAEIDDNLNASEQEIMDFATDRGMSDPEAEGFLKKVDTDIADVMKGKITKTFLGCMFKGYSYEDDLKASREAGKIEGLNENIDNMKTKDNSDLPPEVTSSGTGKQISPKRQWGETPESYAKRTSYSG
jgi:hypothetical protein